MRTFCRCINNGVVAIVTAETYRRIEGYNSLSDTLRAAVNYPTPIFTFVVPKYVDHATYRGYVTGSTDLMDRLLAGAVVAHRDFYVPFSNCTHLNGDVNELRYRTSLDQSVEAFGLEPVALAAL